MPTDVLQTQVFEKISVNGRPLSLATTLIQTIYSLNDSLQKRNQLIEIYRANSPIPDEVLASLYFGLADRNGHIDMNYPGCIDAIYSQTDDSIQFSFLLCKDLQAHGEELRKNYRKQFKKDAPKINQPEFKKAEEKGLMPDPSKYSDWERIFIKREELTVSS